MRGPSRGGWLLLLLRGRRWRLPGGPCGGLVADFLVLGGQERLHFLELRGVGGREILAFADVVLEVIELEVLELGGVEVGFRLRRDSGAGREGLVERGEDFPVAVAKGDE